jgi:basic membrane lipoprotein Med (substrate-binding protein (PBP1-ABC) superfamily)
VRGKRWIIWAVAVGGVVLLTVVLTWLWWPSPKAPAPRARQYTQFVVCLLTGEQGIAGTEAAPVWAGMEDASLASLAKVQYLPVTGPATEANAEPYLTGLVQRQCDMILAVGTAEVAAVRAVAHKYPDVVFAVVGAGGDGNVHALNGADAPSIRSTVAAFVIAAAKGAH